MGEVKLSRFHYEQPALADIMPPNFYFTNNLPQANYPACSLC